MFKQKHAGCSSDKEHLIVNPRGMSVAQDLEA